MSSEHQLTPDEALLSEAAETLRLIAEPTRLHLLFLLIHAERNVSDLVAATGASRTLVSQHLAKLRLGGLVVNRREGRNVYYRVADGHVVRLVVETLSRADHVRSGEPLHG